MTKIIGIAMNMTVESLLFSVNAMNAPPTMTIGALIIMRIIIRIMSWIWRMSFVVLVISEGVPILSISHWLSDSTLTNSARRSDRPKQAETFEE